MKPESLVPTYETCKALAEVARIDSYFVWVEHTEIEDPKVSVEWVAALLELNGKCKTIPAPLLAELLAELPTMMAPNSIWQFITAEEIAQHLIKVHEQRELDKETAEHLDEFIKKQSKDKPTLPDRQ